MFRYLLIAVCGLSILLTNACKEDAQADTSKIYPVKFGENYLYIPKEYISFGDTAIETNGALLRAWYPGYAIVPGRPEELWKRGEYWKSVGILIHQRKSEQSFNEFAKKSTRWLDATEQVSKEYGLLHMTQPEGKVKDKYDLWQEINGNETISYITCSEQILKTDRPQCKHELFVPPSLWLTVSYDKKLLPEWKKIQLSVQEMIHSFGSIESSQKFILERTQEKNTSHLGE